MKPFLIALFALPALSEYRVYQYMIESNLTESSKIVSSSFHPAAYKAFHPGVKNATLMRTWICPGHTGSRKPICPSPYQALFNQQAGDLP